MAKNQGTLLKSKNVKGAETRNWKTENEENKKMKIQKPIKKR